MADLRRRILRAGAGLLVSLLLPLVAKGIGWPAPLVVVAFSAVLGAFCLWVLGAAYARLIEQRGEGTPRHWLYRHLGFAAAGAAAVHVGAVLLHNASIKNSQLLAAYALAFVLGGLVPVVQVIRVDSSKVFEGEEKPLTPRKASLLNGTIIVVSAVLPALVIAGTWGGFIIGVAAGGIWWLAAFLGRSADNRLQFWLNVFVVVLVGVFGQLNANGLSLWWTPVLVPIGLGMTYAVKWGRRGHGDNFEWHLYAGLVMLVVGVAWFIVIIGDNVSWVLVAVPVVAAAAFGASLVFRGEGLLVVMALGLLTVWVVQDHTPIDQPTFSTAGDEEHIIAFGDSYMSGEGIGTFYQGTNTSGADDYTRNGEDNCRRSPLAYSVLVATERAAELDFRACSGAKSITHEAADGESTLAEELDENTVYGQLLRWESDELDSSAIDLVLLSLGGNDAGFSAIGTACFMPGSCRDAIDVRREQDLAQVTARVSIALEKAGEIFPGTPMVVIAYPQMFGPDTDMCGGQVPFDGTEVEALGDFVLGLNSAVSTAISRFNDSGGTASHFSGGAVAFDGSRFCEVEDGVLLEHSSMNILNLQPTDGANLFARLNPTKLIHNTFHPTEEGHHHVAASLTDFLDRDCHLPTAASTCRQLTASMSATVAQGTASNDSCPDIESYVGCALTRTLKVIAVPILLLIMAGRFVALGIKERRWIQDIVGFLRGGPRLVSTLGHALPIDPEAEVSPPSVGGA